MALLSWADLSGTEQRLRRRRRRRTARPHHRTPRPGRPARAPDWNPERSIRAGLLHQLLTGRRELDTRHGPPLAVRLGGGRVDGPLTLADRALRCPLELRGCHLDGAVDLNKATGPNLSLAGSHLSNTLTGRRLRLDHDLDLTEATCQGGITLPDAHIGGALVMLRRPAEQRVRPPLDADRLTVAGGLFLTDKFTATGHSEDGAVRLLGAHIGGPLECTAARLSNNDGPVLDLAEATLGPLVLSPGFSSDKAWSVQLSGLTYRGIPAGASLDSLEWWLDLLQKHTPGYAAQPWQQLAAGHRAAGHERDARRILIAQQDDRRRRLLRPDDGDGVGRRASLWAYRTYLGLLKLVVGYGHQTWRALIALLLILAAAAAGLGLAAGHIHINATHGRARPRRPSAHRPAGAADHRR